MECCTRPGQLRDITDEDHLLSEYETSNLDSSVSNSEKTKVQIVDNIPKYVYRGGVAKIKAVAK